MGVSVGDVVLYRVAHNEFRPADVVYMTALPSGALALDLHVKLRGPEDGALLSDGVQLFSAREVESGIAQRQGVLSGPELLRWLPRFLPRLD